LQYKWIWKGEKGECNGDPVQAVHPVLSHAAAITLAGWILPYIFLLPVIVVPVAFIFFPRSTGLRGLTWVTIIVAVLTPFAFVGTVLGQIDIPEPYYHWFTLIPLAAVAISWLSVAIIAVVFAVLDRYGT
jgi:hypothetical protein